MRVDLQDFEDKYRAERDPWGFASDQYEQRKYAISVASLPSDRYRRCFEPGCSIGALTERLARIADRVLAWDASPSAIATRGIDWSTKTTSSSNAPPIPEQWPLGSFDLVVLSEIGYYWDEGDLEPIIEQAYNSLEIGGHLLAVHWLGHSAEHILHGTTVHTTLGSRPRRSHHPAHRSRIRSWTSGRRAEPITPRA